MASPQYNGYTTGGNDANCTIAICPVELSIYGYQPSLPANATFIALFCLSLGILVVQGIRWKTYSFIGALVGGYLCEIIGYAGRILLHQNPFNFTGFLIQIICLTIGPAFFSAGIYLTLGKISYYLGSEYSRFNPKRYLWIFVPCDIISLTLQAAGGALSSTATTNTSLGVDIALAGLSFQVATLVVFSILAIDFAIRYARNTRQLSQQTRRVLPTTFKLFIGFLTLATLTILIRCIYRIDELSDGYDGPLIHNENLFIGFEGVMIVIAVFSLNACYPGIALVFSPEIVTSEKNLSSRDISEA